MGESVGTEHGNAIPGLADVSSLREPSTARGLRTRAALVAAARVVFERDGFLASRLTDITTEAQCSVGTFYTYFQSKDEIFTAVLDTVRDDMLHPGMPHVDNAGDPVAVIEASNRAYLTAYLRNAKLMTIMQQVASIDPIFREVRRRRAQMFNERNARHIASLQERGLADPTLDPLLAGKALSGLVSRVALELMVEEERDLEEMVALVTKLWVNALKLQSSS